MSYSPRLGLKGGTSGKPIGVTTNSFAVTSMPNKKFTHYDAFPNFDKFPNRHRALEIIDKLQIQFAYLFNPRAGYDGQRNMFRSDPIDLPNNGGIFKVFMGDARPTTHPNVKGVDVKISRVAEIDPRSLKDVIDGRRPHDSQSLTSLTLLNVLIRMQPIMTYPSNARSFFTQAGSKNTGEGFELWRGLFQSVRPAMDRLVINVDVATAVMYTGGGLIDLLMNFLHIRDVRGLSPSKLDLKQQRQLDQFIKGLFVTATVPKRDGKPPRYRKLTKIVMFGADDYEFLIERTGETLTVTEHFKKAHRYNMTYGQIICVEISKGVVYPLEVLAVKVGQMYKKTLPPSVAPQALKFATQRPHERSQSIEKSVGLFAYTQSDYLRQSGMSINTQLMNINARILGSPPILWGQTGTPDFPSRGAWNVLGKKFYQPAEVKSWAVAIFDARLRREEVAGFVKEFRAACSELGMVFPEALPPIIGCKMQGTETLYHSEMERVLGEGLKQYKQNLENFTQTFILVVLPDYALEIRTAVKSWGDCLRGIPTQCMKREKLVKANNQYCNNLALKVNVKLGGVNSIPIRGGDTRTNPMFHTMNWLDEKPIMIVGADVSHAAPDSDRPSVTALVSSVDANFSQYVASCKVQRAREEIIEDLPEMLEYAMNSFNRHWRRVHNKNIVPSRIIFFRDGVSEGQFGEVGRREVDTIKDTLVKLWRKYSMPDPLPKLTFIIVAKKHHVRFFPRRREDGDKSGNCPPGLVVDSEIVSPVDYDFYLQSHAGLLGTSRPSHYSVIRDENGLNADRLQEISYTLCHVYARATRSVSIPAPVYYADIVCARGRFHSRLIHDGGDDSTAFSGEKTLEEHKNAFHEAAKHMKTLMYFM